MNQKSARTSTMTLERNVPVIRLKNEAELREIYEFGRKLGHGSFGAVYEATHIESQTKWAIKMVGRPVAGSSMVEMVDNEINILKHVNHAHIIHLEAVYNTAMMIYFVTELCKGGDLKKLLQKKKFFTEDETRYIISCLSDAVFYLHKRDIVHRDLKLQNILVKNSLDEDGGRVDIKVADFGLSMKMGGVGIGKMMKKACGTLTYMAPEMMRGRGYSHWCDVWSIGVIMFMLLCGEPPFVSETKEDLLKKIMNKGVQFTQPAWAAVSDAAKHLLTCLLCADPAHRMSAHELLDSSWITGTQTLEFSSLTDFEDMPEPPLTSLVLSKETDRKYGGHAGLSPGRCNCSPTPSTSMQLFHAGKKCSTQLSAEQRSLLDKKDLSTGQEQNKAEDQTTSSSSKVGLDSVNHQLALRPKNTQHKTKEKKLATSHEKM
ncbi:serine/threonine-protein kinase 33 isoform X2 [Melanotaenia boesemani]|uniref:serine/threonine-protein kinase 33 isoform X2 n=1 Tax=Melanotaenia boesemani TaxID=1250792 RepID=UPI001C05DC82|nr:serine/threonine-protein kinase 33 isoform X2 [Melanotaenia boesemani]